MITGQLLVQGLVLGLLMGGLYALIALSLALVFGVLRVLNFAHGDLLMVAMYGVLVLREVMGLHPYWSPLVLFPLMLGVGLLVFTLLIRPVQGASVLVHAQLTLGLSFVIQSLALMVFGADLMTVRTDLGDMRVAVGGVVAGVPLLVAFGASLAISGLLSWTLTHTRVGQRVRATAQDPLMAGLCGINVPRVQKYVFGISVALLAVAAACLLTFFHVTPTVGLQFSVLSLLIVVLGGLGDLRGAFFGGLLIGVAEVMTGVVFNSAAGPAAIYVVFAAVLLFRPRGLFGGGVEA